MGMSLKNSNQLLWLLLLTAAVFCLGILDYLTGWEFGFFVFYFIPITFVAYRFKTASVIYISLLCSLIWFSADLLSGHPHIDTWYPFWDAAIRLTAFLLVGLSFNKSSSQLKKEVVLTAELREALSQVKTLTGLLPICCSCKKMRDDNGYWQQIEVFLAEHSDAKFTHGYCTNCAEKFMAEAKNLQPPQKVSAPKG